MEALGYTELTSGNGTAESLWVRIKGQTNNADVIVGVWYRPPDWGNDTNKLFFEELRDTSKSTAFVLMGHFSLSEINWEHHRSGTTWARRFLKDMDDNFMKQVLRDPTWKGALLDLLLVNRVDLLRKVEIGGHLGHSDHKVIEFKISVDRRKSASKTSTLDMRRAAFRLLRELLSKVPWENVFADAGIHQCWSLFKHHLLRHRSRQFPDDGSQAGEARRLVWLSRNLHLEIRQNKKVYAQWKQGQVMWEEFRDAACTVGRKLVRPKLNWN
ncbi:adaptin ear-binding coat-associated protein 1 [Pitangus sulphuratus]|nr:adaptin ear-binding coat-associated protein 1 [Pitangus sulphuratus]